MTTTEHKPAEGCDLTMTLSHIIKLRTNDGRDVIDFLVDVMQDRYKDFQICHRLQAAKLLTTYGNEDAPNFIDENTTDSSSNTRKRRPRRPTRFDTELVRVIREDTNDGRSIARFLVNVMEGEFTSFRPHHRMSAARELLDRGFGKSARKETPPPVVPAEAGTRRRQGPEALTPGNPEPAKGPEPVPAVRPEPVEGPDPSTNDTNKITVIPESDESQFRQLADDDNKITPIPESDESQFRHSPVVPAESATQKTQGQEPLTPHSSPLTPNQTDILDTLIHLQPERFEQTVLDLLEGIGYGRSQHLGRTGDGGIDGIINPDPLGLDSIYVQAKRWTKPVGEPEIRNFSGSLDPHGATRGLLITTSDFTDTARRTADTISAGNKHIRLVDGRELAQLMISLNMEVETVTAHRTRKLDEDHPAQHT